jgi:hypothetical protein
MTAGGGPSSWPQGTHSIQPSISAGSRTAASTEEAHFRSRDDVDAAPQQAGDDSAIHALIGIEPQRDERCAGSTATQPTRVSPAKRCDRRSSVRPLAPNLGGVVVEVRERSVDVCQRQVWMRLHDLIRRHPHQLHLTGDLTDLDVGPSHDDTRPRVIEVKQISSNGLHTGKRSLVRRRRPSALAGSSDPVARSSTQRSKRKRGCRRGRCRVTGADEVDALAKRDAHHLSAEV